MLAHHGGTPVYRQEAPVAACLAAVGRTPRSAQELCRQLRQSYGQQVPPLGQQKVLTSETQSAVHPNDGSQHVESWAQTAAMQGSLQPVEHSAAPAVQTSWHWQVGCVVVVVGVEVVVVVGG